MAHTLTLYRSRYEPNSQNVADVGNHSRYLADLENMGSDYTLTIEDVQYHKNNEPFKVKHSYDYIISMGFNYCKFKSDYADYVPEYDWAGEYYYFIVGVEYVNNNDTLLHVIPDYWHTYSPFLTTSSFDSVQLLRRCIYSGETPPNYSEDFIPSKVKSYQSQPLMSLENLSLVWEVTEFPWHSDSTALSSGYGDWVDSTGTLIKYLGREYNSPCSYFIGGNPHTIQKAYSESGGKSSAIVGAYLCNIDTFKITYDTTRPNKTLGWNKILSIEALTTEVMYSFDFTRLGSNVHPKIYTSQFSKYLLNLANGNSVTIPPETLPNYNSDDSYNPNKISVRYIATFGQDQNIVVQPITEQIGCTGLGYSACFDGLPMIPIITDSYLSWLSRNRSSLTVQRDRMNFENMMGVASSVGNSIVGFNPNIFTTATSAINGISNMVFDISAFNAKLTDASRMPDTLSPANPLSVVMAVPYFGELQFIAPPISEIQELSKYFYSCGIRVAEFYGSDFYWEMSKHKYFDFIQTSSVCIKDFTPQARIAIESMLNRGIRIFHDDYWVETMYKPDNTTN